MSAALIASDDQPGWACFTSAAAPAVIGDAIDVPDMRVPCVPLPIAVDLTLTPGAMTSGLTALSTFRGPPEVNEAATWYAVFGTVAAVKLFAVPPSAAASLSASLALAPPRTPRTPKNGIVTWYGAPVSGFEVMLPSYGGNVVEVLIKATAAAPACCPKIARATRAQVPRSATTSFPV